MISNDVVQKHVSCWLDASAHTWAMQERCPRLHIMPWQWTIYRCLGSGANRHFCFLFLAHFGAPTWMRTDKYAPIFEFTIRYCRNDTVALVLSFARFDSLNAHISLTYWFAANFWPTFASLFIPLQEFIVFLLTFYRNFVGFISVPLISLSPTLVCVCVRVVVVMCAWCTDGHWPRICMYEFFTFEHRESENQNNLESKIY